MEFTFRKLSTEDHMRSQIGIINSIMESDQPETLYKESHEVAIQCIRRYEEDRSKDGLNINPEILGEWDDTIDKAKQYFEVN